MAGAWWPGTMPDRPPRSSGDADRGIPMDTNDRAAIFRHPVATA